MESANQSNNNKPWLFQKGKSGNPSGRPKGTISLKEYAKKYLRELDEEEKLEFIEGLPKDIIWKMAEGNAETKTDVTSGGKPIPILNALPPNNSNEQNTGTEETN